MREAQFSSPKITKILCYYDVSAPSDSQLDYVVIRLIAEVRSPCVVYLDPFRDAEEGGKQLTPLRLTETSRLKYVVTAKHSLHLEEERGADQRRHLTA